MPSSSSPATRVLSSTRYRPYSFSFRPRWIARSRRTMLCAFEPVKYWSAAPRLSRGTRRRSAWKPPHRRTLDFVSPCARIRSTSLYPVNTSMSDAGAPAARMSRSPQVSQPRRRLPTIEISASGACSRSAATSPAAVSCASAISRRPMNRRCSSRAFRMSASFFPPIPFISRMRPSRAACSSSSSVRMPSSPYSRATVFGPTPCRCSRSSTVGGNSCSSSW